MLSTARVSRRAGGVWCVVDVLAVDVNSGGNEGRPAMTPACVSLLETEELELLLDAFDEVRATHLAGWSVACDNTA